MIFSKRPSEKASNESMIEMVDMVRSSTSVSGQCSTKVETENLSIGEITSTPSLKSIQPQKQLKFYFF